MAASRMIIPGTYSRWSAASGCAIQHGDDRGHASGCACGKVRYEGHPMRPEHRVFGIFFIFALSIGAMLSRFPDFQRQLGLSESELGLTILGLPIGALTALTISTPLIVRLGARTTAFATVFG